MLVICQKPSYFRSKKAPPRPEQALPGLGDEEVHLRIQLQLPPGRGPGSEAVQQAVDRHLRFSKRHDMAVGQNQSYAILGQVMVGARPIVEPILVGIGMFSAGKGVDPWPHGGRRGVDQNGGGPSLDGFKGTKRKPTG